MKKIEQYITSYNLDDILIKEVHEKLLIKHYKKGEYILEAHKGTNSIYFIVEGTVEVSCILDNGNQICLNILRPLEIFGDIEYINKEEVLFDVVAKSDVIVILLPFQLAKDYLEDNINFWRFLAIEGNNPVRSGLQDMSITLRSISMCSIWLSGLLLPLLCLKHYLIVGFKSRDLV